jgi:hypothetical protein
VFLQVFEKHIVFHLSSFASKYFKSRLGCCT